MILQTPHVRTLVKLGIATEEERTAATQHGVELISYSELHASGEDQPSPPNPPQPDDIATICYTSGTTGRCRVRLNLHVVRRDDGVFRVCLWGE